MRISVVIPALNEADALPNVLRDLPWDRLEQVIVVDNGSTDATAEVARAGGADVVHEPRRGYGQACLTGIAALRRTDVVVFVDADYSDHPDQLDEVVAPILAGKADMVIGSRSLGEAEAGALTPQQRWGNALAVALIRWLYRVRYTDLGPFRAIRADALRTLRMRDTSYGWTVEMQVKAARQRLRTTEVPVRYRRRIGVSKISGTIRGTILAGWFILTTIARYVGPAGQPQRRTASAVAAPRGVSVVIPALNEEASLPSLIERLRAMRPVPHEIIVCDGGSEDETVARATSVGARVVRSPRPCRALQCNMGAGIATGDILWFVHADTSPPSGATAVIRHALRRPSIAAGTFRFALDGHGWRLRLVEFGVRVRSQVFGRPFADQGFFVRRQLFEKIAGFPIVPILEETDFVRRLRRAGRIVEVAHRLPTSARRWRRLGILRASVINWLILFLDQFGWPRERLARLYSGSSTATTTTSIRDRAAPSRNP